MSGCSTAWLICGIANSATRVQIPATAFTYSLGDVGDYIAMLWMPPNPDHIKIQKITKVEQVVPEGVVGLWKGVSKEDLFTVPIKN